MLWWRKGREGKRKRKVWSCVGRYLYLLPEKKIPLEGEPTFSMSQFESISLVSGIKEASAGIKIMNLILI